MTFVGVVAMILLLAMVAQRKTGTRCIGSHCNNQHQSPGASEMHPALLKTYTTFTAWRMTTMDALREERGEGIVSVAIAVLIMAALGVVAYGGFNLIFDTARDNAQDEINNIGG